MSSHRLSNELVLKCYPHKESILYNLDIAFFLHNKKRNWIDGDRIETLVKCRQYLQNGNSQEAYKQAKKANYLCMAEAILIHWKEVDV